MDVHALAISDAQWGLIGTSSVAVVGLVGQLFASDRERRSQRELRRLERQYEDKVRRQSLLYERRQGVYVDLLSYLQRADRRLGMAERLSEIDLEPTADNIDLRARIGAVGSAAVTAEFDRWGKLVEEVGAVIRSARTGPSEDNLWDAFVRLRDQARGAVESMEAQIKKELDDI